MVAGLISLGFYRDRQSCLRAPGIYKLKKTLREISEQYEKKCLVPCSVCLQVPHPEAFLQVKKNYINILQLKCD